jgi:predicted amidophosphoribosyltransferase
MDRRIAFARARAAIVYDDRARRFVRAWKEHGRRGLAEEAATLVADVVPRPGADVALTYVPGDPERALTRGDVGPRALARGLGAIWELPALDLLQRVKTQPRQQGLTLADRRRNVRGAVAATRASPRAVCLVDDVYTSGATADACASALRKAGAARVEVVTLARAVR